MTDQSDRAHETILADGDPAPPRGRSRRWGRAFLTLLIGVAIFVGGMGFERLGHVEPTEASEFERIGAAWETLYAEYVEADELDPRALAYGAIAGMAEAVGDTGHTAFLTPEEAAVGAELMSGTLGGIGIRLDDPGDPQKVVSLDPDEPAIRAGIEIGDRIIAVDGASTEGPDGEAALDGIIGMPGVVVTLTIERQGRSDPMTVRIMRARLDIDVVDWVRIPGTSIGLLRLQLFSEHAGTEVAAAVREAEGAGVTGLILDLRGNSGGYLDQAIEVAGAFLPPGDRVLLERDRSATDGVHVVPSDSVATDLPLVMLVDADSASAAEILTGALQEAKRATVVGTTTAGTGTILTDFEFDDGAVLSVGIARWFTPSGRSAWHIGLTPDVIVELPAGVTATTPEGLRTASDLDASADTQLLAALGLLTGQRDP